MLQQTQVDRVIPFYRAFLRRFPSVRALARAPLADVLSAWQGLGYNRRAKMLHEAAQAVVGKYGGRLPKEVSELEKLPGIGPYTARAVAAFAHNKDVVFVETNLRTAVLHHFFPGDALVKDAQIVSILEKALPAGRARDWYAALMDYGAHLKRHGVRLNHRSAGYVKQPVFKGSKREARGAVLKALTQGAKSAHFLERLLGTERKEQVREAIATLVRDGMLQKEGRSYVLPGADRKTTR
jgi:A/G-specific adenine glycosylase